MPVITNHVGYDPSAFKATQLRGGAGWKCEQCGKHSHTVWTGRDPVEGAAMSLAYHMRAWCSVR